MRYQIEKYPLRACFFEPNYNQEFSVSSHEEYVNVLLNLENLKFSKMYPAHEFRCKLEGLDLPLEKLCHKKWGRKKKKDEEKKQEPEPKETPEKA